MINELYTTDTRLELVDYSHPFNTETGIITTGNLIAGSVLGRINTSVGTPYYGSENTGTGTIGTISLGAQAFSGVYQLECIDTDPSTLFRLKSPLGDVLSEAIGVGSQQTTTHLIFTITQGDDDFVEGDLIMVPVLGGNYKLSATAAVDGSAIPSAILLDDVDASSVATAATVLTVGTVFTTNLVFGTGHSVGTVKEVLRSKGIYFANIITR